MNCLGILSAALTDIGLQFRRDIIPKLPTAPVEHLSGAESHQVSDTGKTNSSRRYCNLWWEAVSSVFGSDLILLRCCYWQTNQTLISSQSEVKCLFNPIIAEEVKTFASAYCVQADCTVFVCSLIQVFAAQILLSSLDLHSIQWDCFLITLFSFFSPFNSQLQTLRQDPEWGERKKKKLLQWKKCIANIWGKKSRISLIPSHTSGSLGNSGVRFYGFEEGFFISALWSDSVLCFS